MGEPGVYYLFDGYYEYRGAQNPSWMLMKEGIVGSKYIYSGENTDSDGTFIIEGDSSSTLFETPLFAFVKTYPGSAPVLYLGTIENNQ